MPDEELMTTEQVAKYLHVHPKSVTRWVDDGTLPAYKVGRYWRYRKSDVDAFLEMRRSKPKEKHEQK